MSREPRGLAVVLAYGLLAVAAAALVYRPATHAYFYADDFVWMLRFRDEPLLPILVSVFGGHALVLRNVVFYVSWTLFGVQPPPGRVEAQGQRLHEGGLAHASPSASQRAASAAR